MESFPHPVDGDGTEIVLSWSEAPEKVGIEDSEIPFTIEVSNPGSEFEGPVYVNFDPSSGGETVGDVSIPANQTVEFDAVTSMSLSFTHSDLEPGDREVTVGIAAEGSPSLTRDIEVVEGEYLDDMDDEDDEPEEAGIEDIRILHCNEPQPPEVDLGDDVILSAVIENAASVGADVSVTWSLGGYDSYTTNQYIPADSEVTVEEEADTGVFIGSVDGAVEERTVEVSVELN